MTYLLFGLCAGLAAYVQAITGFAFALVLLGLTTALHLASIGHVADVASMLVLLNAAMFFRRHPLMPQWRVVMPALVSSCVFVVVGLGLLQWLTGNAAHRLSMVLGLTIIGCSTVLMMSRRTFELPSGRMSYALAGALSGLLGGMFAASGPPLVFHMHRQPLPMPVVQQCLMLATAVSSAWRLLIVTGTGHLSVDTLWLALASAPFVFCAHWLLWRVPPRLTATGIRQLTAVLLGLTGLMLVLRS